MNQRSPVISALLALFIPFYALYWFYVTGKSMAARGAQNVPDFFKYMILPILLLVIVAVFQFSGRFLLVNSDVTGANSGTAVINAISLLVGLAGAVGIIVLPIIYYYRFSAVAASLTKGQASTVISFIFFLFLAPLGVFYVQDALNRNATSTPAETPASSQAPLPPKA